MPKPSRSAHDDAKAERNVAGRRAIFELLLDIAKAVAGRGNLQAIDVIPKNCFATLIAMDGMHAENAGAFFYRNDVIVINYPI
jgi:hypothetical protein